MYNKIENIYDIDCSFKFVDYSTLIKNVHKI